MSMNKWQHLKIPFEDINIATKGFENCIGKGGYGWVYKGELSISGKQRVVAVKRLNEHLGQGLKEFLTEIQLLSGQDHPNLISLLGYCDDGREKIIVYEYAERGSLDKYIRCTPTPNLDPNPTLTWLQRLKICVAAARGLDHLHNHAGEHQTIIHRDLKSANILLDKEWVAKISDLGLSRLSLAGLDRSAVISHACGTPGYCEPEYIITGIVTKKSDVYSFGMVLFEVLCGRLCTVRDKDGFLLSAELARLYYENKKLDEIIDPSLREQMNPYTMIKFAAIAYECLLARVKRPLMDIVTKELEETLKIQEEYEFEKERKLKLREVLESETDEYWEAKLPRDVEEIVEMFKIPHDICCIKKTLFSFLRKGILFDEDNKVFQINNDGKKCEFISARRCVDVEGHRFLNLVSHIDSRFPMVVEYSSWMFFKIKCQIKTGMLSLGTMYEASLVFKHPKDPLRDITSLMFITIKLKTQELSICSTNIAEPTADNWYKFSMWQFFNHGQNAEFEVVLEELSYEVDPNMSLNGLLIQGIEFHPIEMMQHEDVEGFESLDISEEEDMDDDEKWEKKLPDDYLRYIKMSDKPLYYTSKKELFFLFCAGFVGDNGQLWFSLYKSTDGICSMLPARDILCDDPWYIYFKTLSLAQSRFGEAKKLGGRIGCIVRCRLRSPMFSPQYVYSCYLIFKFKDNGAPPDNSLLFEVSDCSLDGVSQVGMVAYLSRSSMNIPTIKPKNDYGSHDSSNIPRNEGPRNPKCDMEHYSGYNRIEERKDGWMEVMLCKPLHHLEDHMTLDIELKEIRNYTFYHMIIEGIEFRPCI